MKKLVLSLSLVLAFSSTTAAFAAIPQKIRTAYRVPCRLVSGGTVSFPLPQREGPHVIRRGD